MESNYHAEIYDSALSNFRNLKISAPEDDDLKRGVVCAVMMRHIRHHDARDAKTMSPAIFYDLSTQQADGILETRLRHFNAAAQGQNLHTMLEGALDEAATGTGIVGSLHQAETYDVALQILQKKKIKFPENDESLRRIITSVGIRQVRNITADMSGTAPFIYHGALIAHADGTLQKHCGLTDPHGLKQALDEAARQAVPPFLPPAKKYKSIEDQVRVTLRPKSP